MLALVRARRMERLASARARRRLAAHHRRQLRLGRGRAGHEGEPRAPGFRGAVHPARRALRAARPNCGSIARASIAASAAPPATSPSPASARWSPASMGCGATTTRNSIACSPGSARRPARRRGVARLFRQLEPLFNRLSGRVDDLLRLNQEAMQAKSRAAEQVARRWFMSDAGAGGGPRGLQRAARDRCSRARSSVRSPR